jgi:hypothetical protein
MFRVKKMSRYKLYHFLHQKRYHHQPNQNLIKKQSKNALQNHFKLLRRSNFVLIIILANTIRSVNI